MAEEEGKTSQSSSATAADDLIFFYGEGCRFTEAALPEVQCLEQYVSSQLPSSEENPPALWAAKKGVPPPHT
jgi:hypothetical protein